MRARTVDFVHTWYEFRAIIRALMVGALLRVLGYDVRIGKGTRLTSWPKITHIRGGKVRIGRQCRIGSLKLTVLPKAVLLLGDRVSMNDYGVICVYQEMVIGENTLIGEHVSLRDGGHRFDCLDVPIKDQGLTSSPVFIEDNVWVGRGVAVLAGVTIGTGAVIGANSVVTSSIEPMTVATGAPARVIRRRC